MIGLGLQIWSLWQREMRRFSRQRSRLIGAVLQPVVFWFLLGAGLNGAFRPPGAPPATTYMEYFYPGVIVLVLLFTAIFSTISTIEDRREGFLQGVVVAPISPAAIVVGQALGSTTLALGEGLVFLVLAPLAGISLSLAGVLATVATMAVIAFGLAGLGLALAWRMESTQGFHAIMNLILIPIWLLSGAFFPRAGAPRWLQSIMSVNPLTYAMALLRGSLYLRNFEFGASAGQTGLAVAVTIGFAALMLMLAVSVARRGLALS
jgi:ABC-2 type transport system permease protein